MIVGIGLGIPFNKKRKQIIVKDNFNRSDNTTSLSNTETGQTWTSLTGTWGVIGNQAYNPVVGSPRSHIVIPTGATQFSVEVTLNDVSAQCGVIYRAQDDANLFRTVILNNLFYSQKLVAGAVTTLASVPITATIGDRIKVVVIGNNIYSYYKGVLMLTATDSAFAGVANAGLESVSTACRFDNFIVEAV